MCGVVGAVARRDVVSLLIEGLRRLEYRGYDSAGIAVIHDKDGLKRARRPGKLKELQNHLLDNPLSGKTGIAHTRWATHGKPSEENAHPHLSGNRVVLVHNGIIENYEALRNELTHTKNTLSSETDTEIVAALIYEALEKGQDFLSAVQKTAAKLEGAYAICVMDAMDPTRIIGLKKGPPLIVGVGEKEHFLTSDVLALKGVTDQFIYLEDEDLVELTLEGIRIFDKAGKPVDRKIHTRQLSHESMDKQGFRHFMQKEIYEQPTVLRDTLIGAVSRDRVLDQVFGINASAAFDKVKRIQIVACGTSFHAGLIARYWLESIAGIPTQVEIASEFRYRKVASEPDTLLVCISQSGETADTLAALRAIKKADYCATLTICNVPESSMVRESDLSFMTKAGPEIGVCSTKAFMTQLAALFLLTLSLGRRTLLKPQDEKHYITELLALSSKIETALQLSDGVYAWAKRLVHKNHTLFLGRALQYPVALEGALKLKEISYIHAEAYPAGELKHGPLALVDKDMPIVALMPQDAIVDKLKSNLQEIRARGGELFLFADKACGMKEEDGLHIITVPSVPDYLAPLVYTVPLQLLAYHVAVLKGTDVDQPRNLAKSVTVE